MTDVDGGRPRREWLFGLVSFALGLLFSLLPRFMFDWCEFTEFGYLQRIPGFIVVTTLGLVALGLVVAGGLTVLIGRPIGKRLLLIGAGLGLGVGASFFIKIPAC